MQQTSLLNAILPLYYWDEKYWCPNNRPSISKIGTLFFIEYLNDVYAVTAKHCINMANIENLFISLTQKNMKGIPVSKIIGFNYQDSLNTDTEVVFLKIPFQEFIDNVYNLNEQKIKSFINNMPFLKRQARIEKKKAGNYFDLKKYKIFCNLRKHFLDDIYNTFEQYHIKTLNVAENLELPIGAECQVMGYPQDYFDINLQEKSISVNLRGIKCVYCGKSVSGLDFVFEYGADKELNGISGGPVFYDNKVIAVATDIRRYDNKLYATPLSLSILPFLS